ncbi:hypothetical protein FKM82_012422 [Ascaphus truei]
MISMITEQLQKQSLEELKCKSFSISLPLPDHPDPEGCSSPYHFVSEDRSWGLLSHCPGLNSKRIRLVCHHHSSLSLHFSCLQQGELTPPQKSFPRTRAGNSAAPPAPLPRDTARSLSVPEDLSRWRPVWRPSGSKLFGLQSRGDVTVVGRSGAGIADSSPSRGLHLRFKNDPSASIRCIQANSPPSSAWPCAESHRARAPFPLPVYSGKTQKGRAASLCSVVFHCHLYSSRTRDASLLRPAALHLPRRNWSGGSSVSPHQSQPCDLDTRKCGIKRRHEEDTRWHRPSLDFYKMNQNAGAMCFLDNSDEGSSSSPFLACHRGSPCTSGSPVTTCTLALSEEEIGRRDHASCSQAISSTRLRHLDLNLIEEN